MTSRAKRCRAESEHGAQLVERVRLGPSSRARAPRNAYRRATALLAAQPAALQGTAQRADSLSLPLPPKSPSGRFFLTFRSFCTDLRFPVAAELPVSGRRKLRSGTPQRRSPGRARKIPELGAFLCAHDSRMHTARMSLRIRHFFMDPRHCE